MEGKEGERRRGEGRPGYTIPNRTLLAMDPSSLTCVRHNTHRNQSDITSTPMKIRLPPHAPPGGSTGPSPCSHPAWTFLEFRARDTRQETHGFRRTQAGIHFLNVFHPGNEGRDQCARASASTNPTSHDTSQEDAYSSTAGAYLASNLLPPSKIQGSRGGWL
ncbi:hypothetical protein B0H13DRAFT_1884300 [Mycena leptocephala]|nr:hypothetical protein B0H13DRAFT_1884300 [Mycena leptocephala]